MLSQSELQSQSMSGDPLRRAAAAAVAEEPEAVAEDLDSLARRATDCIMPSSRAPRPDLVERRRIRRSCSSRSQASSMLYFDMGESRLGEGGHEERGLKARHPMTPRVQFQVKVIQGRSLLV